MLKNMFLSGAKRLDKNKEYINELNVFPVPDGDTGTNMTMTIMSAAREVQAIEEPTMAVSQRQSPRGRSAEPEAIRVLSCPSFSAALPV